MHNRARFWSPVPDWSHVSLHGADVQVTPVTIASLWLLSGNAQAFLARHGIDEIHGPRQRCDGSCYALRISPDRLLFVSEQPAAANFGWSTEGFVLTDVSDGMLVFDIGGDAAADLLAQGSEYPFARAPAGPQESASMRLASFRLLVSRRAQGWRLHIGRPWAPALWHWLQAHVE